MNELLANLKKSYPAISFVPGQVFSWSPKTKQVIYKLVYSDNEVASWSLLHEVGHALLDHVDYFSDFQLLLIEVSAWEKAKILAEEFNINIDESHIQDCLDTYRDWLYQRSTCPACTNCSLQINSKTYQCFNCGTVWRVSASRMCRPYRRQTFITSQPAA